MTFEDVHREATRNGRPRGRELDYGFEFHARKLRGRGRLTAERMRINLAFLSGPQRLVLHWAIAIGSVVDGGCGGVTHVGTTNDGHGASGSGTDVDASAGGGGQGGSTGSTGGGSAGVACRGVACGSGGRVLGSGGRSPSSGGSSVGGAADGGVGTGGGTFDAGSDPGRNRVPPNEACARLTTIQCAAEALCCPTAPALEVCRQAGTDACTQGGYFDAIVGSPVIGYDIDRAEKAFAEFEKRASVCDPTIVRWAISNAGFRGVARGTLPAGAACMPILPSDASPLDAIGYLGACADPETMSCFGSSVQSPTWTCIPRSAVGGPCFVDLNCSDGLYCELAQPIGHCLARKANGSPCSSPLECESLYCDYSRGVCARPTLADVYCLPH